MSPANPTKICVRPCLKAVRAAGPHRSWPTNFFSRQAATSSPKIFPRTCLCACALLFSISSIPRARVVRTQTTLSSRLLGQSHRRSKAQSQRKRLLTDHHHPQWEATYPTSRPGDDHLGAFRERGVNGVFTQARALSEEKRRQYLPRQPHFVTKDPGLMANLPLCRQPISARMVQDRLTRLARVSVGASEFFACPVLPTEFNGPKTVMRGCWRRDRTRGSLDRIGLNWPDDFCRKVVPPAVPHPSGRAARPEKSRVIPRAEPAAGKPSGLLYFVILLRPENPDETMPASSQGCKNRFDVRNRIGSRFQVACGSTSAQLSPMCWAFLRIRFSSDRTPKRAHGLRDPGRERAQIAPSPRAALTGGHLVLFCLFLFPPPSPSSPPPRAHEMMPRFRP